MLESDYFSLKRDPSNWNILSNDGVTIQAQNEFIKESFSGTFADFYSMLRSAEDFVLARYDRYTGAAVGIDLVHYKMHSGKYFTHTGKLTSIAHNATYDHLYVNPEGNYPHFRDTVIAALAAPLEVVIYEDTVLSGNGTLVSSVNLNRNSTNVSKLLVYHNPTVTSLGNELTYRLITGTAQAGGSGDAQFKEVIMKPNTNYLVRLRNISNQSTDVAFDSEWYE